MSTEIENKGIIIEQMIQAMAANPALWDARNHKYTLSDRKIANEVTAKRLKISTSRCSELVHYIKKQYEKEKRRLENPKKNDVAKEWQWFNYCSFLKTRNHLVVFRDFKRQPMTDREEDDEANEGEGCLNRSVDVSTSSAPLILDPDIDIICSSEEETDEEMVTEHKACALESPEEEKLKSSQEASASSSTMITRRTDKTLIIKSIRSTMEYQLSKENYTDKDLVSFHGEVIKFMHSHFRKKNNTA